MVVFDGLVEQLLGIPLVLLQDAIDGLVILRFREQGSHGFVFASFPLKSSLQRFQTPLSTAANF
jgi:hypothetical protein